MLYDMYVKRVDGSKYLAATVNAESRFKAGQLYTPDYGFGVEIIERELSIKRGFIEDNC